MVDMTVHSDFNPEDFYSHSEKKKPRCIRNRAIVARWSFSALEYIKKKAWKIVEGKV